MQPKIQLRNQRISDAKRFFEILRNPKFIFFTKPETLEHEKQYLRKNKEKRKNNFEYNYTILYNNQVVGGCGIKIDQHRTHIGEIGYFLDEKFWNKGITTKAVKLLEKIAFSKLKLKRIEILMNPKNLASEKVAIKCNYKKEGTKKKAIKEKGKLLDAHLYAKIV
jgi:[ribosomal protein S5]-alanine N-acetyltransferase